MLKKTSTNWAGNHSFEAFRLHEPSSVAAVQELVVESRAIHALGTGHSFNGIADSYCDQISLVHLSSMEMDASASTVTIGAGVTYAQLGPWLDLQGYALHNLPSFTNGNIAGSIQTGTHGSGANTGVLATAVVAMDVVTSPGHVVRFSRETHGTDFLGLVVGLGLFGIVVSLTLRVEPTYAMSQRVYEDVPLTSLKPRLLQVFSSGQSVSWFTRWDPQIVQQVWIKSRVQGKSAAKSAELMHLIGAREATRDLGFVDNRTSEDFTQQMGVPGPWHERLPHFCVGAIPKQGKELQSEYFVDIERGSEVIEAMVKLREHLQPLLQISELRAIHADEVWLSPAYHRQTLAVEFTWEPDYKGVSRVLPVLEEALQPFGARPHWAKLYAMRPQSALDLYANAGSFRKLRASLDPEGKFGNESLTGF